MATEQRNDLRRHFKKVARGF